MLGYICVSGFPHHREVLAEPFRLHEFLRVPLRLEFDFGDGQPLEILEDIELYGQSFVGYIVAGLLEEMILDQLPVIIEFLLGDRYFYFISDEPVPLLLRHLILLSDLPDSHALAGGRVVEISLDDLFVGILLESCGRMFH